MTRHLVSWTVFLTLTALTVCGQDSTSAIMVYRSNITLEVGGTGILGSINYEHLISYTPNKKVLLRVGLSDIPYKNYQGNRGIGMVTIPLGIYYLTGNKSHLELGINNTFGFDVEDKTKFYALNPSIGYRYQNFFSKSFSFSAAFSPLIAFPGSGNVNNWEFAPWAKVGLGYSFNSKKIKTQTKSNHSDTIIFGRRIFIEFGTHFLTARQNCISKNRNNGNGSTGGVYSEIRYPIDTSNLYINAIIVNRRIFPTLSSGIYFQNHEFNAEFSYANNKSFFSYAADYGKNAYFNSKDYYFLLGYCYTGLKNE